jgi:hypothetical protein
MENFDLNALGVFELGETNLIEVNGGDMGVSPWWSVVSTAIQAGVIIMTAWKNVYINYSIQTGGEYVIHHAY